MSDLGSSDARVGSPSLGISEDHLIVIVRLFGLASTLVRATLPPGAHENPISLRLLKKIIVVQREFGLTSLEFHPEAILVDPDTDDDRMLGRIDLKVKFLHQFGDYDDYFAVECKRVAPQEANLLRYYVGTGVGKFALGTYGANHPAGMIVGYLLRHPLQEVVTDLDGRIARAHPGATSLARWIESFSTEGVVEGTVPRAGATDPIRLIHVFLDMTPDRVA